ncbi:MAG: hypothetical protein U0T81_01225 [Saprospiraceae bacterium]
MKDSKNGCLSKDTIVVNEIGNPLADIVANAENPKCFGTARADHYQRCADKNGNVLTNLQYSSTGGPIAATGYTITFHRKRTISKRCQWLFDL